MLGVVAWSTFSIGGVYPWAYLPALAGCGVAAVIAWRARHRDLPADEMRCALALMITAAAIAIQIIPVAASTLRRVSPATDIALRQLNVEYALTVSTPATSIRHPLSIAPVGTRRAVLFLAGLTALWAAASLVMAAEGSRPMVNGVMGLAVILALLGIVQQAFTDRPYGIWISEQGGEAFGPFVNRNHYAGWMLLALPAIVGALCATTWRRSFRLPATWRERILWAGSPGAGKFVIAGIASGVSALALVLTYSKAAIIGLCWIVVVLMVLALQRGRTRSRIVGAVVAVGALVVLLVWAGPERIGDRFSELPASRLAGRIDAWRDAWDVARRFPVAGAGINTYGQAMQVFQQRDLRWHYSSAHNDYLQILAEGGALVALPVVFVFWCFASVAWRRLQESRDRPTEWWRRVGALIGITALGWQELVDFSAQIPAVAMLLAVLLAVVTHAGAKPDLPSPRTA